MNDDIKPGQKVRVRAGELSIYGAKPRDYAEVREVEWIAPDGDVALSCGDQEPTAVFHPDSLELVKRADATPAPLDPSKVKAGDTVTLTVSDGDLPTLTVAGLTHKTINGVYLGGWRIDELPDYVTLTDHQPAPEPEPEWEPEAIVRATVNGVPDTLLMRLTPGYEGGFVWATPTLTPRRPENEQSWLLYEDADITDVRPLVVIDPAAVDVDHLVDVGSNTDDSRTNTLAILAGLGIEAP